MNQKTLRLAAFGLFMLLFSVVSVWSSETVDDLNPLFKALHVKRFVPLDDWERIRTPEYPLSRVSGIFVGDAGAGEEKGVVVHVLSEGYGGKIALLVAFDPSGRILRVPVIQHNETQCHVQGLTDGSFMAQFPGIGLLEKLRLLVGKPRVAAASGDVEAMSGGTVSSRAIAEGVAEARIAFFRAQSEGLFGRL
ncbi:MAG: FMN-binding protein [Rectinemataceae bacterium]|nr:FMN-binding protein [Rectinemataceae bacterium]